LIFDTLLWTWDALSHLGRLKCLGGIMHLKHTAGCQISTLIF
jgi:hypothetical protein